VKKKKNQLIFESSVGYDVAKVSQGSCSKPLCMDTLCLANFTKNSLPAAVIDINKLDGALAFQIHGFNIIVYIQKLTTKGIYTFIEIVNLCFPRSLDILSSLFTMIKLK
ncbi:hypothetical protein K501DRAFT_162645, partial [Backusella circina FSU 941]